MQIVEMNLSDLKPYENNPRNNQEAIDYVASSIHEFGFKVPIVIDKDNVIVCGHTRYLASKQLKMKKVPCIKADDLTDEQIKEKMKKFKIDDSRVKVNNVVRIRYADSKDKKSKTDARMQTEMTFTL